MNKALVVFNENGEASFTVDSPWPEETEEKYGEMGLHYAIVEGMEGSFLYWDAVDQTAKSREEIDIEDITFSASTVVADGVDHIHVSGLPAPCRLSINGQIEDVDDGEIDIATQEPGPIDICLVGKHISGMKTLQAVDLDAEKNRLLGVVDEQAGAVRSQFITTVPGQESTYIYKANEARAWTEGADPAQFPMLAAEAVATGVTIDELAQTVIANADLWTAIGAKIEAARLGAKQTIKNASGLVDLYAAAAIDWETTVNG